MRRLALCSVLALAACAATGETRHHADEGALGPYSAAVESGGLVFLSGKLGPRGGTFEDEARGSLEAVAAELARHGLGLGDLVSVTVYLTDMARYSDFNAIYGELLPAPFPARACVAVAALPAGARVEVQGIARR